MTERVLPTGTVTFLFSDIEGSTRLVQDLGPAVFTDVLEQHNAILRDAFARHEGVERGTQGDSFLVMFRDAPAALTAAAETQTALARTSWPSPAGVGVRMGVHTGLGTLGGDDYVGLDVNRAARIASAAHGGQVLVSDATRVLAEANLPPSLSLLSLGEHRLKDIARPEHLHQLVVEGLPAAFPPIRTLDSSLGNLPARVTSFIGRDAEIGQLGALLAENRLITLTGPGGTGKSSLAVEVARANADRFEGGAWFVPLDSVPDAERVAGTIGTSLGLFEAGGLPATERLVRFLGERRTLLVVDNFEHVLPAAPVLAELIQEAPGLKVLVTSRAPLRIAAEQEFPVPPLPLPGPIDPVADAMRSPAITLFIERARRVRPGYTLTPDDARPVAEICRRLDGLPLGIELAAARVGLLPPSALAHRLAHRLDLPGVGGRDLPERQRTLQGAVAWSYDLLAAPEQRLLARLSVFAGGCRLEEAEAVCGPADDLGVDVLDGLSTLVDHSLVQPAPGPEGARFRLLETIRMFAAGRCPDEESARSRRRHAEAYLGMAEAAAQHLPGRGQRVLLARLEADHDNLRAALDWAIENGEVMTALRLGAGLWRFWQLAGHLDKGRRTLERILALPGADEPSTARLRALEADGGLRYWSGDLLGANERYKQQLELARELGDRHGMGDAMYNLAHTRFIVESDEDAAAEMQDAARALFVELGDDFAAARVHWTRTSLLLRQKRPEVAREEMLEGLRKFRENGDDWYVALAEGTISWADLVLGDFESSVERGIRALRLSHELADIASTTISLRAGAILAVLADLPEEAITINAAFDALCARYGVRPPAFFETMAAPAAGDGRPFTFDAEAYPDAAARGASMSLDEAVDYVVRVFEDRSRRLASSPAG